MSAKAPYEHWQASGTNSRWVFYAAGLGCRLLPREKLYRVSDSLMDWYLGKHPELLGSLEHNVLGAFPAMERKLAEALAEETLKNYGRGVVDYLRGLFDPPEVVEDPDGARRLASCHGAKVLLCAHMGNWEIGGMALGKNIGAHTVVSFPERDAGVETFRQRRRAAAGLATFTAGGGLQNIFDLRSVLARGETVIVLVDRSVGKDGVQVRFRGRSAAFLRSPALLAELAGAWAIPAAVMAEGPGRYVALVGEPCRRPGERCAADVVMQRSADFFGKLLERYPNQWYNFFRYWREAP